MNVSELILVIKWIDKEIKEPNIVGLYTELHGVVHKNSQPNQAKQSFEDQKNSLFDALKKISVENLTLEQIEFLKKIKIYQNFGPQGINAIEDILFRNSLDAVKATEKIKEKIDELNTAITKTDQIFAGLSDIVETDDHLENEVNIRVNFSEAASISNVEDLKNWGAIWYDIGRGIAIINGATPQDIRIIGAGKGSILLNLAVSYGVAQTIALIIIKALDVTKKVLDIKRTALEINNLKLENQKIAQELSKAADDEKKKGVETITNQIILELKINSENQGDKISELKRSITKLINFLEKGGRVDCIFPDDVPEEGEDQNQELKKLRDSFSKIRLVEGEIRLLENDNDSEESEKNESEEESNKKSED